VRPQYTMPISNRALTLAVLFFSATPFSPLPVTRRSLFKARELQHGKKTHLTSDKLMQLHKCVKDKYDKIKETLLISESVNMCLVNE